MGEAHSQRNEKFFINMRIEENVKNAYKNIFAQKFSTDGKFLFLGDNFGSVHVVDCMTWNSIHTYQTGLECIYNFELKQDGLLCCGVGGIELLQINIDSGFLEKRKHFCNDNINSSALLSDSQVVYGGAGGDLSVIDILSGSVCQTLKGAHKNIIQSISAACDKLFASSGEDGIVKIWDLRESDSQPVKVINPFDHEMTKKSKSRRFVSTLSYRGSWLTVGGGQKSGIWHVGSGEPAAVLDLEGDVPLCSLSAEGRILLGSTGGKVHQFQKNGAKISTLNVSSPIVYSIQETSSGYLSAAGNTNQVDVFRNYGFKIQQFSL